jgi:epoxyqueuosine reductase
MLMKVTAQRVKELAERLGFALCGVAQAGPVEHADEVRQWLAAGRHGAMKWMEEDVPTRLDPRRLVPGARSVICVADDLGPTPGSTAADRPPTRQGTGRVARYAQVDDYHRVMRKRLHELADQLRAMAPEHRFRTCVDTAPILERHWAHRAGLGWVGKNTMLIHPRLGSHLMLGEIVTTLALRPDGAEPDHCGQCMRCIQACPTGAITPYSIDASRCVSYLTIEHRGAIDPELSRGVGEWVYGCDDCQQACPYNEPDRVIERHAPPAGYGPRPESMELMQVMSWSEADRQEAFVRSAMKRAKLEQMKRNALVAAGNQLRRRGDPELHERVRQIADDAGESELVREAARWALREAEQAPQWG